MSVESMLAKMARDWRVEITAESDGADTFWKVSISRGGDLCTYVRRTLASAVAAAFGG